MHRRNGRLGLFQNGADARQEIIPVLIVSENMAPLDAAHTNMGRTPAASIRAFLGMPEVYQVEGQVNKLRASQLPSPLQ